MSQFPRWSTGGTQILMATNLLQETREYVELVLMRPDGTGMRSMTDGHLRQESYNHFNW
jgi:hypothetical protein